MPKVIRSRYFTKGYVYSTLREIMKEEDAREVYDLDYKSALQMKANSILYNQHGSLCSTLIVVDRDCNMPVDGMAGLIKEACIKYGFRLSNDYEVIDLGYDLYHLSMRVLLSKSNKSYLDTVLDNIKNELSSGINKLYVVDSTFIYILNGLDCSYHKVHNLPGKSRDALSEIVRLFDRSYAVKISTQYDFALIVLRKLCAKLGVELTGFEEASVLRLSGNDINKLADAVYDIIELKNYSLTLTREDQIRIVENAIDFEKLMSLLGNNSDLKDLSLIERSSRLTEVTEIFRRAANR